MTNQVVYLSIYDYIGITLGATHYHGELRSNNPHIMVELKKSLTKAGAIKLNKKSNTSVFKAGDMTEGFDSEEEVRLTALNTWKNYFPDGKILLEGSMSYHEPKEVLYCEDEPTKTVLNTIYKNNIKFKEYDPQAVEIESFESLWFLLFELYLKRI